MLVKTKIGPSQIAGIGLFADQFISKGTPVWKFEPGFDLQINEEQFAELSEQAKKNVLNYCYFNDKTKMYVVCSDDVRFFNHSETPNCSSGPDDNHIDVALRDIKPGEELTQNYLVFDGQTQSKLNN